jgi:hypothetical protein
MKLSDIPIRSKTTQNESLFQLMPSIYNFNFWLLSSACVKIYTVKTF